MRPDKIMLLHGKNDNIIIPMLSYLGVYQYEAKKWEIYKDIILFLGWNQTKKTDKKVVHVSPTSLVIKKNPTAQLNGCWV